MKPKDLKVFYETKDEIKFACTYWNTLKIKVKVLEDSKTEEELQIELFTKIKSPTIQETHKLVRNPPTINSEEI